jgi:hypothetical protein
MGSAGWGWVGCGESYHGKWLFLCGAMRLAIVLKDTRSCGVPLGSSSALYVRAGDGLVSNWPRHAPLRKSKLSYSTPWI